MKYQLKTLTRTELDYKRTAQLQELRTAISIYDTFYYTGCETLDYLLREKSLFFQENNVQFSCMADGKILKFIDDVDLYTLLGNMLDNALEAVLKEPEEKRIISLNISLKGKMVTMHLENYYDKQIEFQDELPVTDKENKNYHGFGMQSIRYITKKYWGELLVQYQDNIFSVDIMLPMEKECQ